MCSFSTFEMGNCKLQVVQFLNWRKRASQVCLSIEDDRSDIVQMHFVVAQMRIKGQVTFYTFE